MAVVTPLERLEGKYEILEKIQEGGMGAIYKVRHRLLGEERVIKVMRPHLQNDEILRTRFLQEARAAARLSHPNIARIFDFTIDDEGVAYIVMELIPGSTLGELIRAGQRPGLPLVLEIARQSLDAIGYIHRQKVVHRDIAPDNLMLYRDDSGAPRIKLIDLGLAKSMEGGGSQLTGAGIFVGKFRYAAPEHFEAAVGDEPFSADLYAFSLVLYELLTGKYPISGDNPSSLIAGHLFRPPMDFSLSDPQHLIPETLRQVVLRGLAKSPAERFESAEAFAAALTAACGAVESSVGAAETERILSGLQAVPSVVKISPVDASTGTQARFDRSFLPEPTPLPEGVSKRLQGIDPNQETVVLPPVPAVEASTLATISGANPPAETMVEGPGGVELVIEEIEEAIAEGDFEEARNLLQRTESQHGGDRRLTELAGRISEIEEIANRPVVGSLLERAQLAAEQDRHQEALDLLDRARKLAPGDPQVAALRLAEQRFLRLDQERQERLRLIAERVRTIATSLDDGRLDDVADSLDHALEAFGPDPAWQDLRVRLDELRGRLTITTAVDEEAAGDPAVGGAREPTSSGATENLQDVLEAAHRKAQNEDFAAAKELLESLLQCEPGHREALATLASVEACLSVRDEEAEQSAAIERTVTDLREMLQTGRPDDAVAALDRADTAFGDRKELAGMRFEVARARLQGDAPPEAREIPPAASPEPLPSIPPPLSPPASAPEADESSPTPSTAFQVSGHTLEETMVEIESQIAGNKVGRALEVLQHAVQVFGQVPELREARSRLSLLLLDRDAEQNEAAARVDPFGTVPSLRNPARRERIAETGDPADGLSEAPTTTFRGPSDPSTSGAGVLELTLDGRAPLPSPAPVSRIPARPASPAHPKVPHSHGGLELDTEFRATTEWSSGARRKALPNEPGGRRLGLAALVVALLVALGLGLGLLPRWKAPQEEPSSGGEMVDPKDLPAGFLKLDASPWAEIVELTDAAGEEVPITPSRYTPVVLHLPPGRYHLIARYPTQEESQELDLEIVSAELLEQKLSFGEIEGRDYFSAMGW